jgi:hypothetical protein
MNIQISFIKKMSRITLGLMTIVLLSAFSPQEIQQKSSQALTLLKTHAEAGHDVSQVIPKMKQVKKLGKDGDLNAAGNLLDEILSDFTNMEKQAKDKDTSGPFINPQLVKIKGYNSDAAEAFISRNGKYLFFNDFTDHGKNRDIHWAKRQSDTVFIYQGRVKNVNSSAVDGVPSMDNSNRFYYISTKNYNAKHKFSTIYSGDFNPKTGAVENIKPHTELSLNKPGWLSMDLEISPTGKDLYGTYNYFTSKTEGPQKSYLFLARKQKDGTFNVVENSNDMFKKINNPKHVVYAPSISRGVKELYFTRFQIKKGTPVNMSSYMATRSNRTKPFGEAVLIPAASGTIAEAPSITGDGQKMYFHRINPATGKFAIYMLTRN